MTRALVIRFSSMGDIILTAPVIRLLSESDPQMTIDYLVHDRYVPLVARFAPAPHNVLSFPADVGATQLPAYARQLAASDYDLVIDLHDSLRSKLLRRYFQGAELRVYRKPRLRRWMLFYLWLDRFEPDYSVVREYLSAAQLSAPEAPPRPQMAVDPQEAGETLQRFGLQENYLVCVPGAAWPQKSWLPQRYAELFTGYGAVSSRRLVLLGGPGDEICDRLAAELPSGVVHNLKGKTTLEESLAILSHSRLVIGADTGLVHAGEALGVPAVVILGPTSWQTGARAHHPESRIHEVPLWCRPCSQNGRRRCYRREQYCLTGTTAQHVAVSVNRILGRA